MKTQNENTKRKHFKGESSTQLMILHFCQNRTTNWMKQQTRQNNKLVAMKIFLMLSNCAKKHVTGSKCKRKREIDNDDKSETKRAKSKDGQEMNDNDHQDVTAHKINQNIDAKAMRKKMTKQKTHVPSGPSDNIKFTIQLLMDKMSQSCREEEIDLFFKNSKRSWEDLLLSKPSFVAKQVQKFLKNHSALELKTGHQTCPWRRLLGTKVEPGICFPCSTFQRRTIAQGKDGSGQTQRNVSADSFVQHRQKIVDPSQWQG